MVGKGQHFLTKNSQNILKVLHFSFMCVKMKLPNNLNIHSYRSFSVYGKAIAFFVVHSFELVLVKTQLPFECMETYTMNRLFGDNWSFAFFGAVTPVAALFVCTEEKSKGERK